MRWLDGITDNDGHEFEQALGVGDGQGTLVSCSPWGHKEFNMNEQLTDLARTCLFQFSHSAMYDSL